MQSIKRSKEGKEMKIEKIKLDDIKRCYCASNIYMIVENHVMFASEDPNVLC